MRKSYSLNILYIKVLIFVSMIKWFGIILILLGETYAQSLRLNYDGDLIPYRRGELWGYAKPNGQIVIPPQFESASWFYKGLAKVANNCNQDCYDVYDGEIFYINKKGERVSPPKNWLPEGYDGGGLVIARIDTLPPTQEEYEKTYLRNILDQYDITPEGVVSKKGIKFYDDPETTFFLAFEKLSHQTIRIHKPHNMKWGEKLKPALVLLKINEKHEIEPIQYLELKLIQENNDVNSQDYNTADYQIVNPDLAKKYWENTANLDNNLKWVFTASFKIPAEELLNNTFFNLYRYDIQLDFLGYHSSPYEFLKDYDKNVILKGLLGEVQEVGKIFNEKKDSQNQRIPKDSNVHANKMLFDAMEQSTQEDIKKFLRYMEVRPFYYMASKWNISEIYAAWLVNSAPVVIEK